jgi:hypothetical protein
MPYYLRQKKTTRARDLPQYRDRTRTKISAARVEGRGRLRISTGKQDKTLERLSHAHKNKLIPLPKRSFRVMFVAENEVDASRACFLGPIFIVP